jgi:flagellar basal-body rod protein FlgF
MENALLIGLSRQVALSRELDVIANNVANIGTNGFKGRSARYQEYVSPTARANSFMRADQGVSFVTDTGTPLDTTNGTIEQTGAPLDAAIKGDGYFVVQTPQGERYTRNGSFELNATGQLVTSDGHPVVGDSGPINISPTETGVAIAKDGAVSTTQGQRGRLKIVKFDNPQSLTNDGVNVFSSTATPQPAGPSTQVEPGALERSNVKPVLEMARLIQVNRSYASVSSILTRMDEMRRNAIQKLADITG